MHDDIKKRLIRSYEVIDSRKVAGTEVILAKNLLVSEPYLVCRSTRGHSSLGESYTNGVTFLDFTDAVGEFNRLLSLDKICVDAERVSSEFPNETLSVSDCEPIDANTDITNKLLVIKAEVLSYSCRSAKNQLTICQDKAPKYNGVGYGINCANMFTGAVNVFNRTDFAGIMTASRLTAWILEKSNGLEGSESKESVLKQIREHKPPEVDRQNKKKHRNMDEL